MRKQQIVLLAVAAILIVIITFAANKVPPLIESSHVTASSQTQQISDIDLSELEKQKLSQSQLATLAKLEQATKEGNDPEKILALQNLSNYWHDSLKSDGLSFYYLGEKAKLENSEKNLNFAANSLLSLAMSEHDASQQKWLASKAKDLFEKSLAINPRGDSAVIGLGSTYMFGNISDNPMDGILKVRSIADADSTNVYAQKMLALGAMKTGQYANAVKRFERAANQEPDNMLVIFSLAECYERLSDKQNAIKWYQIAKEKVGASEMKKEIEEHIRDLQLK